MRSSARRIFSPFPTERANRARRRARRRAELRAIVLFAAGGFVQGIPAAPLPAPPPFPIVEYDGDLSAYRSTSVERGAAVPDAPPPGTFDARRIAPDRVRSRTVQRWLAEPDGRRRLVVPVEERYVPLRRGDDPVRIVLPDLQPSLYTLFVYGTIARRGREELPRVWKPCPMEFRIVDDRGREIERGRKLLKQGFFPRRMQGFHFHVPAAGDYTAYFRLTDRAEETAEIQWIRLVDRLEGLPDAAVKKTQNIEKTGGRRLPGLSEARRRRDDRIWAALPPLNTHFQVHPPDPAFRKGLESLRLPPWRTRAFAGLKEHRKKDRTFAPLDLENPETGEILSGAETVSGVPWPGPFADDGTGVYLSRERFPSLPHDLYATRRAELLGERYLLYVGAVVDSQGRYRGLNLARRYAETGDPETGHDGALALVRIAWDWPALELSLREIRLCTHAPDFEYGIDWTHARRRNGKFFYAGWAGADFVGLLEAYDRLFPYIDGNEVFAEAVGRFVPRVKTPRDVVRLLDRYLVFAGVRDYERGRIRAAPVRETAAVVLGPSPYTNDWLDLRTTPATIYPLQGPFGELYATVLTRDGIHYIGSFLVYGAAVAKENLARARLCARGATLGFPVPMDLSDASRYPKIRAAADFLIDRFAAGGFALAVGDASGGPHDGRVARERLAAEEEASRTAFDLFGDPRHAWLLRNLHGIDDPSAAAAATGVADPILHNVSRVLAGAGAAVIESRPEEDDPLKKTALVLRTGVGRGHAHHDYLDLNLFGLGLPLAVDLACRDEGRFWSRPPASWSFLHNHAMAHDTLDPRGAGVQTGEPWVAAFEPPVIRARYVGRSGVTRIDRDLVLMDSADAEAGYVFDVQRVEGMRYHTWAFHGCESEDLRINVPMKAASPDERWLDRLLPGSTRCGTATDRLQAVWTMTRRSRRVPHPFRGGGAIETVACEPAVLGEAYDASRPPVRVRATLLGRSGDKVLEGVPYSEPYRYAFPFLWVRTAAGGSPTIYPAVYEWYRGDPFLKEIELRSLDPLVVTVRTREGRTDRFVRDGKGLAVLSREPDGSFSAWISGRVPVDIDGWRIAPERSEISAEIVEIDYAQRRLRTRDPLPDDPRATAGNPARRIYLELRGSGTSFSFDDDLLVQEGRVRNVAPIGDDRIALATDPPVLFEGYGNRSSAGFTRTDETGRWILRGDRVLRRPSEWTPGDDLFTDADGDGVVHAKTYEIGIGDTVSVRSWTAVAGGPRGPLHLVSNGEVRIARDGKEILTPPAPGGIDLDEGEFSGAPAAVQEEGGRTFNRTAP